MVLLYQWYLPCHKLITWKTFHTYINWRSIQWCCTSCTGGIGTRSLLHDLLRVVINLWGLFFYCVNLVKKWNRSMRIVLLLFQPRYKIKQVHEEISWSCFNLIKKWNQGYEDSSLACVNLVKKWNKEYEDTRIVLGLVSTSLKNETRFYEDSSWSCFNLIKKWNKEYEHSSLSCVKLAKKWNKDYEHSSLSFAKLNKRWNKVPWSKILVKSFTWSRKRTFIPSNW